MAQRGKETLGEGLEREWVQRGEFKMEEGEKVCRVKLFDISLSLPNEDFS